MAVAWVLFRADTVREAVWVIGRMFADVADPAGVIDQLRHPPPGVGRHVHRRKPAPGAVLIAGIEIIQLLQTGHRFVRAIDVAPAWLRWAGYYALILTIIWIGDLGRGALSTSSSET